MLVWLNFIIISESADFSRETSSSWNLKVSLVYWLELSCTPFCCYWWVSKWVFIKSQVLLNDWGIYWLMYLKLWLYKLSFCWNEHLFTIDRAILFGILFRSIIWRFLFFGGLICHIFAMLLMSRNPISWDSPSLEICQPWARLIAKWPRRLSRT